MAKLVLSRSGVLVREIPLTKETTIIGRRDDNDIALDDTSISGQHVQLVKADNKYIAEDLKSTNGTVINSQKMDRKVLENDDVIVIGKHELRFVTETEMGGQPSDFEQTVVIRSKASVDKATPTTNTPPTQAPTKAPATGNTPPAHLSTLAMQPPQQNRPAPHPAQSDPTPTGGSVLVKALIAVAGVLVLVVVAYLYRKMGH